LFKSLLPNNREKWLFWERIKAIFLPSDFLLMDTVWSLESYQAVQGSIVDLVVYVGSRLTLLLQIDKKNDLVKYRQAPQRELDLCVLRALRYPGF